MRTPTSASRVAQFSCSLEVIVAVLGGKWKPGILFNLMNGPLRFAELRSKLGVTEKVLTQQLRELQAHGVVARHAVDARPPRVTYALTSYGTTLRPILIRMGEWGEGHLARLRVESLDDGGAREDHVAKSIDQFTKGRSSMSSTRSIPAATRGRPRR